MHVSKRGSAGARKKEKGHYVRKGKVCQPRSLTPFRQLGAHGALSALKLSLCVEMHERRSPSRPPTRQVAQVGERSEGTNNGSSCSSRI